MAIKVGYDPRAQADLDSLYDWIADHAGPVSALEYVERLQSACERLVDFPHRGAPRDDLAPGLRMIAVGRKDVIVYIVENDEVLVLGIFHRGRDLQRAFDED